MKGRRATVLIEPYKQLRFGVMFLCLNFVFSLIAMGTFTYFLWDIYSAMVYYFNMNENQSLVTMQKLLVPFGITAALFIGFIISTLYLSARYTHQFYGPLVSINRFLDDLIEKREPEEITLRANDQLQDLAQKLNVLRDKHINIG